jgi:hypothetical protein
MWGAAADDVYAVVGFLGLGYGNYVLHFDGVAWSPIDIGGNYVDTSVWGSRTDNVFVAAFDPDMDSCGDDWRVLATGGVDEETSFRAVGGTGPDDIWLAGDDGLLLHYPCE